MYKTGQYNCVSEPGKFFKFQVMLPIRKIDIVTSLHDLSEHFELSPGVEGHEVHASVPAEVTPVKPIPVLEIKSLKK